ncbi:MAG: hypothetical protein JJE34_07290 [Alphaproteobacteria bacterium]|nr:hypothetical protein [Alphaproteobacteria bacterium]
MGTRIIKCLIVIASTGMSVAALPALADTVAALDMLSRATDNAASGLALARKLIESGDLLGAMASLERVMINHPESNEALLLHASLLCRVDDRGGSLIEFDELRGRDFPDQVWADATAPCAALGSKTGSGD